MKKLLVFVVLAILLFSSCQTYRTIVPTISGKPRSEFRLKKPIIISFRDYRESAENSQEVIESLKFGLKTIYGRNIVFRPYFDKTGGNSVAIKIDIKEIGSSFGIRTLQYQTFRNQVTAVSSSVSTYWGSAVATAIISQPVIENNFVAQGYWVGTSYLNISLVDNLHTRKRIYNFPFVGEDEEENMWGYKSATHAAQNSWKKVSSNLLDLIDAIAMKIIETE